jgi:hypothetical protein
MKTKVHKNNTPLMVKWIIYSINKSKYNWKDNDDNDNNSSALKNIRISFIPITFEVINTPGTIFEALAWELKLNHYYITVKSQTSIVNER